MCTVEGCERLHNDLAKPKQPDTERPASPDRASYQSSLSSIMALFRRAKSSRQSSSPPEEENKREKGSWKRPASPSLLISLPPTSSPLSIDTAFKQQRLKAWQPI